MGSLSSLVQELIWLSSKKKKKKNYSLDPRVSLSFEPGTTLSLRPIVYLFYDKIKISNDRQNL